MKTIPDHINIVLELTASENTALGKAIRFYMEVQKNNPEAHETMHALASISQKVIRLITLPEQN